MAQSEEITHLRILVTGAAGFLGSHLVDFLLKKGHQVIGIDSFQTGSPANLEHLEKNSKFKLISHNIQMPLEGLGLENIDQIFNLACPASPIHYQRDPISTLKTCFQGIENILELAKANKICVLHTSTSEVYGDPQVHPQPESYWGNVNPFGARSCYDEGKRVAEALCYAYQEKYPDLQIRIARIFNTYGPRMAHSDGRVVSSFIGDALAGQPIKITGDGTATRSFQYITDCVEGLYRLMNSDYAAPVNIGNPGEFKIREFAEIIVDMVAELGMPRVPITYLPRPADDPNTRKPDITRAKEVLGWEPEVKLKDGLVETIKWHMEQSR
ncbi:hypothetical protein N7478_002750 [Penicillium angulare]|uniref:uncharacterized protein n=1 Tax=Penicillium angulare TaxID=116970 RepID=UPI0025411417|nr:uncharacterized protein N7478_002750 [Penicillium angulare]KAJ5287064.1 hypothetical protein N7478_002750 [Penicillium angulare]